MEDTAERRAGGRRAARLVALGTAALLAFAACRPRAADDAGAGPHGYVDVTAGSGLAFKHVNGASGAYYFVETNGSGCGLFDYDRDGDLDAYFAQGGALTGFKEAGPFPSRLFRNDGPGPDGTPRFTDVTEAAHAGALLYATGCCLGDYDGDGWSDVFVYGLGSNALLRNRGDGTFEDVSKRAGVGDPRRADPRYAGTALYADFDRDGDLDLFVGNYVKWSYALHRNCAVPPAERSYCHPDVFDADTSLLYRNNGDGTFTDVSFQVGITRRDGKTLGALASDVDDDGDLDLFVANDSSPNFLYRNDGAPGVLEFGDASESSALSYDHDGRTQGSMGCDFADVDGDLSPDLAVTNLEMEATALYVNDGHGHFDDQAFQRGIGRPSLLDFGWGLRFLDFDDDGDMDLLEVNGHLHPGVVQYEASQRYEQEPKLYLNDGTGHFTVAAAGANGRPGDEGGPFLTERMVARGLALGDLDDDGDLDGIVSMNDHDARLFVRAGRPVRRWIGFALAYEGKNPDAIGARVDVTAGGKRQRQEVRGAASFASWQDLRLLFGLADREQAEVVLVRWPRGEQEEFGPLPAGRYHRLERGKGRPVR
jgi:hypothetical protein